MRIMFILSVFVFFSLFLFGCSGEAPVADEDAQVDVVALSKSDAHQFGCGRIRARLASTGQIQPPLLTANGEMTGNLRGTVNYVANLGDIVSIASSSGNDPVNPAASFTGTWTLTNPKGILTFRDVGVFEQIPNGLGTSYSIIIDGTGFYEGASGFLFLSFISDSTGLNFQEELQGEIFCAKHKNNNDE